MRWCWAAYRQGWLTEVFGTGLTQAVFKGALLDLMAVTTHDWIIEVGGRPVGLVLGVELAARRIEPHVDWFPWASARNKIEGIFMFVNVIGESLKIYAYCTEGDSKCLELLARARMLRRGCKVLDHFAKGEHAMLYYSVGP